MAGRQKLVVFLGLSPSAHKEAHELELLGNQVLLIANGKVPDVVRVEDGSFDLSTADGREAFVARLRLSDARALQVRRVLESAGRNMRDELGNLALIWARAEHSRKLPGRMVISGEHIRGMFWGNGGNGMMSSDNVKGIADVFPTAAAAIEDLYLSACNSATDILDWPKIFPKLKTMWAYLHTAPSLATGGKAHIRLWDRATRGNAGRIDRHIARNTGRGENVAVWSSIHGLQTGTIESVETLRARISGGERVFAAFFKGDSIVTDHQSGPLREYYNDLQSLLQHNDLPPGERRPMEKRSDVVIRLIYYDRIRTVFQRQHEATIRAGYSALALPPPTFGALDRKAALAAIDLFVAKCGPSAPEPAHRLRPLLTEGLRDLEATRIPANWIE